MGKTTTATRDPGELIKGLWYGQSSVTMTLREWRAVLLHYGAAYLHMHRGHGYYLKGARVGPGIYSVRFVEPSR